MLTINEARLFLINAKTGLPVCRQRVFNLIKSGRLKAKKVGRDWLISKYDLKAVMYRKNGHPFKVK